MNRNLTNLVAAAATAASTALLASTVAMSTATAATFRWEPPRSRVAHPGEVTIFSDSASTVRQLRSELVGGNNEVLGEWEVDWGGVRLNWDTDNMVFSGRPTDGTDDLIGLWSEVRRFGSLSIDIFYIGAIGGTASYGRSTFYEFELLSPGRDDEFWDGSDSASAPQHVPEPSAAIALGVLGVVGVASGLRRRSK